MDKNDSVLLYEENTVCVNREQQCYYTRSKAAIKIEANEKAKAKPSSEPPMGTERCFIGCFGTQVFVSVNTASLTAS